MLRRVIASNININNNNRSKRVIELLLKNVNKTRIALPCMQRMSTIPLPMITSTFRGFATIESEDTGLVEFTESEPFRAIALNPFPDDVAKVLLAKINDDDIEIKPDGIMYLPEIKYRRILNQAFGPGGWALIPKGPYKIEKGHICQQYVMFARGQFVSQAWGDQIYAEEGKMAFRSFATALEGAKSNALMRCCKDLGIASELWDPAFILKWKAENAVAVWVQHVTTKQKKKLYRRKDRPPFGYPYVEQGIEDESKKASSPLETDLEIPEFMEPTDEKDVDMFDHMKSEEAPVEKPRAASTQGKTYDWSEKISSGKYKGRTWNEMLSKPEFKNYLAWCISKNAASPQMKAAYQIATAMNPEQ